MYIPLMYYIDKFLAHSRLYLPVQGFYERFWISLILERELGSAHDFSNLSVKMLDHL